MDNEATLSGIIASEPIFSHCIHETRLYTCEICVKRLSDTVDRIVLLAPEALCSNLTGEVTVHGQLRGYTRQDADKRRLRTTGSPFPARWCGRSAIATRRWAARLRI